MPCVSRCRLDFIHAGNLMQTCSVSNLDPTKPDRLKTWLWFCSRTRDRNAKLRAFTQPEPSERLTPLALMCFGVTVKQCLKLWVASIFLRMSESATLSYRSRHCDGTKEERNGRITSTLLARKKIALSLRYGSVSGSFTCARFMR